MTHTLSVMMIVQLCGKIGVAARAALTIRSRRGGGDDALLGSPPDH
jgi:hypothetical protein